MFDEICLIRFGVNRLGVYKLHAGLLLVISNQMGKLFSQTL